QTELLRNTHAGFIAYAPIGSLARGRALGTTGGALGVTTQAGPGTDNAVRGLPWSGAQGQGRRPTARRPIAELPRATALRLSAGHTQRRGSAAHASRRGKPHPRRHGRDHRVPRVAGTGGAGRPTTAAARRSRDEHGAPIIALS